MAREAQGERIRRTVQRIAKIAIVRHDGEVPATDHAIAQRVRALLDLHGMEQKDLARRIGLDPSALSRALSSERTFKAIEIARIAEEFDVSASDILEGQRPPSPVAVAARRSSGEAGPVRAALSRANTFVQLAELVDSRHVPDLHIDVAAEIPWRQGNAAAQALLERVGLDHEPLPASMSELASCVEQKLQIQVALEPLGAGMDGLSVATDRFWMALVSTSVASARQRWTLAHEIAHLVLGDTEDLHVDQDVWSSKTPQESRANAFAATFLMPEAIIKKLCAGMDLHNETNIVTLLERLQVSLDALAFRLHNLGLVNAAGRNRIRDMRPMVSLMLHQGTRQSEVRWLPGRLTTDTIAAFVRGDLGVRWLAELVQLEPETLLDRLRPNTQEAEALGASDEAFAG